MTEGEHFTSVDKGCHHCPSLKVQSSLVYVYTGGKGWKISILTPTKDPIGKDVCLQCKTITPTAISKDFLQTGYYLWMHWRDKLGNSLQFRGKEFTVLLSVLFRNLISAHLSWMSQKHKYLHKISSDFYFQKSQKQYENIKNDLLTSSVLGSLQKEEVQISQCALFNISFSGFICQSISSSCSCGETTKSWNERAKIYSKVGWKSNHLSCDYAEGE